MLKPNKHTLKHKYPFIIIVKTPSKAKTHIKNVKITRKYFEVMLSTYSYEDLQSLVSFEHQKILRNFC